MRRSLPYLALIALVAAAYVGALNGDFLYDDEFLILRNQFLRSWSSIGAIFTSSSTGGAGHIDSFYRPLQGLLYLIVYQLAGLKPWAFHLLNIFIHTANALLVFTLGRRLGFKSLWAFVAAALWAVHPVHTEAVTYMSATADSLYSFFCLLGLCVLVPAFSTPRIWIALAVSVLGFLSKESAVVFPALAVACLFYLREERWQWRSYVKLWPLWLASLLFVIARRTILDFNDSFHFYKTSNVYTEHFFYRVYTFLATLPSYASVLLWPHALHMDRGFPVYPDAFHAAVLIGALVFALAALAVWRTRALAFAVLWFAAAHAPHSGVLLPVNALFLEHWLYLPTVALFWVVVQGAGEWTERRGWRTPFLAALALVIGAEVYATEMQNQIWRTPVTFYENILRYEAVGAARVHNNLAMALPPERRAEAIEHYRLAIQIEDKYPQTHHNLALLYLADGRTNEAIAELQKAIALNPAFFYSYAILSQIYQKMGDTAQAAAYAQLFEKWKGKFDQ